MLIVFHLAPNLHVTVCNNSHYHLLSIYYGVTQLARHFVFCSGTYCFALYKSVAPALLPPSAPFILLGKKLLLPTLQLVMGRLPVITLPPASLWWANYRPFWDIGATTIGQGSWEMPLGHVSAPERSWCGGENDFDLWRGYYWEVWQGSSPPPSLPSFCSEPIDLAYRRASCVLTMHISYLTNSYNKMKWYCFLT